VKEPHFHLRDAWTVGGPEREAFTRPLRKFHAGRATSVWGGLETSETHYRALFEPGQSAKFRLEGTPNYFREPDLIASRVSDFVDEDVYAIATVRDPVDRILSHYRLFRQLGWEDLEFEDAIKAGPDRVSRGWAGTWDYVRYSEYADPIAQWSQELGSRFRVVSYDDLAASPIDVMADLTEWLGVSDVTAVPKNKFNSASRFDGITRERATKAISELGRIDLDRELAVLQSAQNPKIRRPRVTVGMPVLNGGQNIAAALASLQQQTYRNLQIVVCNNASSDGTAEIVREIAAKDPRVILRNFDERVDIKQSYERALDSNDGEYFLFAPADDRWAENFLAAAVGRLQGNPDAAVCCGRIELFDDAGKTWPSGGLKRIRGHRSSRWRRGLLQMDASRLYGLIRSTALPDLFPDTSPEGWDHFAAAKLAWHGEIESLDMTAMYRHQTPIDLYRKRMFAQEPTFWGQVFFMRHVAQMFRDDPDIDTRPIGAKLALWGFTLVHVNLALRHRGPLLGVLRWVLNRSGRVCTALAKVTR
jgi:glycosyltransferase involved in cell wall biosynthesis